MSNYPKSPKEKTGGMLYFARMLDKIRLHANGELGQDYHENLGQGADRRCCSFLRVKYDELRERVLAGGADDAILEWSFDTGRRLNEDDLVVWNSFVSKLGWNDFASERMAEMKKDLGISDRTDILTIGDVLDFDEKRIS